MRWERRLIYSIIRLLGLFLLKIITKANIDERLKNFAFVVYIILIIKNKCILNKKVEAD